MPSWKETERYAIIALVVFIFFTYVPLILIKFLVWITAPDLPPIFSSATLAGLQMFRYVGFGHWLSSLNKDRGLIRLVWFLFGFFFGLIGVGVFYLLKFVTMQQENETVNISTQNV
jgi:phage shock protein PspC (stress-responsive transcriptional regulator)